MHKKYFVFSFVIFANLFASNLQVIKERSDSTESPLIASSSKVFEKGTKSVDSFESLSDLFDPEFKRNNSHVLHHLNAWLNFSAKTDEQLELKRNRVISVLHSVDFFKKDYSNVITYVSARLNWSDVELSCQLYSDLLASNLRLEQFNSNLDQYSSKDPYFSFIRVLSQIKSSAKNASLKEEELQSLSRMVFEKIYSFLASFKRTQNRNFKVYAQVLYRDWSENFPEESRLYFLSFGPKEYAISNQEYDLIVGFYKEFYNLSDKDYAQEVESLKRAILEPVNSGSTHSRKTSEESTQSKKSCCDMMQQEMSDDYVSDSSDEEQKSREAATQFLGGLSKMFKSKPIN